MYAGILAVIISAPAFGQYTKVTAQILDPNSNAYASGSWQANLDISSVPTGKLVQFQGSTAFQTAYSGQLDSSGNLSVSLPDNNVITDPTNNNTASITLGVRVGDSTDIGNYTANSVIGNKLIGGYILVQQDHDLILGNTLSDSPGQNPIAVEGQDNIISHNFIIGGAHINTAGTPGTISGIIVNCQYSSGGDPVGFGGYANVTTDGDGSPTKPNGVTMSYADYWDIASDCGGLVAPADSISLDANSSDNFIRIRGNGSCDTPVNSGVNNTIQDLNKILFTMGAPLVPHNYTVSTLPSASTDSGAMVKVTDSTAITSEGQTCVGSSTNTALAFSNGSSWKCF